MTTKPRPPLWGNFVFYADWDFLAFGLLQQGNVHVPASYHLAQAIEKYLKALALSVIDPQGTTATPQTEKWLKTHNLCELAKRVANSYPGYVDAPTTALLTRLTEFDQATRYPWINMQHSNGFSTADYPEFLALLQRLRTDLPLQVDDYPLGIAVRGRHQSQTKLIPSERLWAFGAVETLRQLIPNLNDFVRW